MPTHQAAGFIDVTTYDATPYETTDSVSLSHAVVVEEFTGGLVGTGKAHYEMAQLPDGSMHFAGIERFTGALDHREGTFLFRNAGVLKEGVLMSEWLILAGTATGQLTGLSGKGACSPSGYFLEYSLG